MNAFIQRKPWATVVIFLFFGATVGMFYLNKGRLGVIYLGLHFIVSAILFVSSYYKIVALTPENCIALAYLPVSLLGIVHGFFLSKGYNSDVSLKWYAHWQSVVLVFTVLPYIVALLFRSFAYEPFTVPSSSMSPTLNNGDYVFASKYAYGFGPYSFPFGDLILSKKLTSRSPERGDLIVFMHPQKTDVHFLKRLVGLPGDTVQIRDGRLILNGVDIPKIRQTESFVLSDLSVDGEQVVPVFIEVLPNGKQYTVLDSKPESSLDNTETLTVPQGHYFVLGDNRDNSMDSRVGHIIGFVPDVNIVARLSVRIWSEKDRTFSFDKLQ